VYEITAYDRPSHVVLAGTGGVFRGVDTIRFSPVAEGTRIDYVADLSLTGFAKLVQPFMGRRFQELGDEAMAGLEAVLST
jgi:carbon monoxide dehydrogenase subunit G